jgi:outer membrane protein OmpA-like peptidoglycan-associated protein
MAVNLVELVSSAITPDAVQGISRVLGERDSTVQSGIGALVPALIGGLAGKASTPSGASNLLGVLNGPNVDGGMIGNLGNVLGSGPPDALLQQGGNLLGGLFGADKTSSMAGALAGMTGMKTGSAMNLLMMVAPMVLGVLKRFISEQRLGPGEVSELFAGQKQFLDGKLDSRLTSAMGFSSPSSLLSGLGETAAGAARGAAATAGRAGATVAATAAAASTAAAPRRSWLPWALAAVVAAVLLSMLPRFSGRDSSPTQAQAPAPATTTAKSESPATTANAPSTPATTAAMGAAPASLPAKIYFDTGKAELGAEGTAVVKSVASMLAANPSAKVALTGFTDKTGDTAANQELAKKRATAVKAALESAGVAPDRVGMKEPMFVELGAGGSDAEARRVEIAAAR